MKFILFSFISAFFITDLKSQTILSQDFEGPLTGWFNQGVITTMQNSVNPHGGNAMLALNSASTLISPTFSLPSGAKNLTFWLNGYNPTPFSYDLSANLLQNGSPVLSLGTWPSTLTTWNQQGVNIPSGYSGNNFSITFSVQITDPTLKFYLDDITLSAGAIGLKENKLSELDFKISCDNTGESTIRIHCGSQAENVTVQVFALDGRAVLPKTHLSFSVGGSFCDIPSGKIGSGLYLIKISSNAGALVKKIVL